MHRVVQIIIASFCLFCVLQCGCLLNHSNHVVLRQGEPLKALTFESSKTRQIFESTVQQTLDDGLDRSRASFGVPFIIGLERSQSVADTAIRNDVATLFDVNCDNHISDYEASLRNQ